MGVAGGSGRTQARAARRNESGPFVAVQGDADHGEASATPRSPTKQLAAAAGGTPPVLFPNNGAGTASATSMCTAAPQHLLQPGEARRASPCQQSAGLVATFRVQIFARLRISTGQQGPCAARCCRVLCQPMSEIATHARRKISK